MSFNESNTVEQMIVDAVENLGCTIAPEAILDAPAWGASLGSEFKPLRWSYVPGLQVPRQPGDVMVESWSTDFTRQNLIHSFEKPPNHRSSRFSYE